MIAVDLRSSARLGPMALAMAPVGQLMAVAGYVLGSYAPLACASILGFLAEGPWIASMRGERRG